MKNRFCKDCKFFSDALQHCAFGFLECKLVSPVDCSAYEELASVKKKDMQCFTCTNRSQAVQGREFCREDQVFFNTKKSEGCKKYVKDGSSVIYLPPPLPKRNPEHYQHPPFNTEKIGPAEKRIVQTDTSYVSMVK